ncbi:DUF6479 family protein [Streptomyces sp. NBC_01294]|uniref:DUF6479 family protein n=1 Tax=Streptomyces sp. NBC_01294 TaxID=2903815 RepID=UPI002DDA0E00|nr:DUF6479 family protein [Streptomyces sp. NBC_01294]WRZ60991.1 DUF6479 family protein [Streptomyces sp. NBC_01294]
MIASAPLAATASSSLFLIIAGVIVAALLIASFWYGTRRVARRRDPGARPAEQSPQAQARQDAWQTPDDSADPQHPRA